MSEASNSWRITGRKAQHQVAEAILNRWSPRAMSGESIGEEELFSLFEAARWAPSSFNNQPWRFIYAKRDTASWPKFLNLLVEGNKEWAQHAAVLIVIVSHNTFEYNNKPSRTHSFDTGAAWMLLALQASINGLVCHGMEGFDYSRAKTELNIPDDYTVEAMCVVGKHGSAQALPAKLQKAEVPSDRKPIDDFIFEGEFK